MSLQEAVSRLFAELAEYDGFHECRPHEGDILVRYYAGTEVEQHLPERYEGYHVRKSPGQPVEQPREGQPC